MQKSLSDRETVFVCHLAGVPGSKGDASGCQPTLRHEGPEEGDPQRYSDFLLLLFLGGPASSWILRFQF